MRIPILVLGVLLLAACAQAPGKQMPDGAVLCTDPRPEACTLEYNPVCGNDDTTYGNGCQACSNAGVSYYLPGACSSGTQPPDEQPAAQEQLEGTIDCTDPRPEVCTKDYRPVCASVDNGIRCITQPCPSEDRKTYGNGCEACADSRVYSYTQGACNPEIDNNPGDDDEPAQPPQTGTVARKYMLCNYDGTDRSDFAEQFGYTCVDACPARYDAFAAQVGWMCIAHYGKDEVGEWETCERSTDCRSEQVCALPTHSTDGKELDWDDNDFRCVGDDYSGFLVNTVGLTMLDENGERSTAIA